MFLLSVERVCRFCESHLNAFVCMQELETGQKQTDMMLNSRDREGLDAFFG